MTPRGTQVRGDNYDSDMPGWRAYVGVVTDALDREASRRQDSLQQSIRELRREEERAFGAWLADEVIERRLGGDGDSPSPTDDVIRLLAGLEGNAQALERHFGQDELFPAEQTLDACENQIRDAKDRFDNPPPGDAALSGLERIAAFVAGIVAFGAALGIANLVPGFNVGTVESSWIAWVVAVISMLAVYRGAQWWFLRDKKEAASLAERRRRAERRLLDAYEERDRVRALQWMHQELQGANARLPFFRELRQQVESARDAVERLAEVYEALEDKATAEARPGRLDPAARRCGGR